MSASSPSPSREQIARLKSETAVLRATRRQMREQIAAGERIPREQWDTQTFRDARRVRDIILTAPARHAAELAAELEVDEWQMLQALNRIARTVLTLATGTAPFPKPRSVEPAEAPEAPSLSKKE